MSGELRGRYERLLRWYPAGYRRDRAAEMLGVLMDGAAEGQVRPSFHERWALIRGGLRLRAGVAGRWPVGESWRSALRAAAVMTLILRLASDNRDLFEVGPDFDRLDAVRLVVGVLALVAVLRGWFAAGLAAVAVLLGSGALPVQRWGEHVESMWFSPWLVIGFLVPLVGHGPVRLPRSLWVLIGVSLVPAGLWVVQAADLARAGWWVILPVAALWALVDGLPVLAVGLVLLYPVAFQVWVVWLSARGGSAGLWIFSELGVVLVLPVLGMTLGGLVARRRARL